MKIKIYSAASVALLILLASCATMPPNQKAGVVVGNLYKFSSPKLDSSLYVKFLPPREDKNELLFATLPNTQAVNDISAGQPNVFKQSWYNVDDKGRVSFRYYQKGNFQTLVEHHKYFISGQQQGATASFRYRLDFKRATVVNSQ
jgi:hypothetical protein